MVRLLTKTKISHLLAKRNISTNLKTSGVIVLTLSLIFSILILVLSIKSIYYSIFSKEAEAIYSNTDIVIHYDEYSPSRFINKREIIENYDDVQHALSFFNIQVLSTIHDQSAYLFLNSALPHELEILLDQDIELDGHEMIVTASLAKEYHLNVGDSISFLIFDYTFDYDIADIIDDQGVMSGNSFFVDKSILLEELFGLGSLTNFGNVIYLKTSKAESVYSQLIEDPVYQDYSIMLVQDPVRIQGMVDEYTSMVVVAGILIILSLFIVLDSLFLIVLKTIFQQISVFDTLGDQYRLGYQVCFHQWVYFVTVSYVISLILSQIVIAFGAYFYGITAFISVNPWMALIGLLIVIGYIFIRNLDLIHRYSHQSALIKIKKPHTVRRLTPLLSYFVFALTSGFLIIIIVIQPFNLALNGLLIVLLSIYVSLCILIGFIRLLAQFLPKTPSLFRYINITHLKNDPFIHQSMRVIFLAFMVVTILLSLRGFLLFQIDELVHRFDVDVLVFNLHQEDDSLLNRLSHEDIDHINMGCFYRDVTIQMDHQSSFLRYMVSMNRDDYLFYFQYPLDEVSPAIETHTHPYVLLPKTYEIVYQLQVGDIIAIDLSPKLRNVSFVVGGFVDSEFDHFAYTNLSERTHEEAFEYNTIFIDSDHPNAVIPYLVDELSSDMMVVTNSQSILNHQLEIAKNVMALFTVMTFFIILSFLLVVFNNTALKFDTLKSEYAKIRVLGYDRTQLLRHLALEWGLSSFFIGTVGLLEIMILSRFMRYILLFFDYYKNMSSTPIAILISFLMVSACLGVSYGFYFRKILNYPIVKEIKTF